MSVYRACCESDLETVQRLVPTGATLGARHRALCAASEAGYLPAIEYLLRLGAPRYHRGWSALSSASQTGELAAVRYLIATIGDPGEEGVPALTAAAGAGHLPVVRYLVELGVEPDRGDAVLERAATGYHTGVIRYLISQGANYRARQDWLFLHACRIRYRWLIRYLVGLGVDWHVRDNQAFLTACERGDRRVVRYLGSLGPGAGLIRKGAEVAVSGNRSVVLRYLIRLAGKSVCRWKVVWGLACNHGQLETVRWLVEAGFDRTNCNLWSAVQGGNLELVEYLIGLGLHDRSGDALVCTAMTNRPDLARCLVDRGGANPTHNQPFWTACGQGHLEMVQYLVEQGSDHQADNDRGFRLACRGRRHEGVVRYLFQLGVGEEAVAVGMEDPVSRALLRELIHGRQQKSARSVQ